MNTLYPLPTHTVTMMFTLYLPILSLLFVPFTYQYSHYDLNLLPTHTVTINDLYPLPTHTVTMICTLYLPIQSL